MLYQGTLYHHHTTTGELEEVFWFVVPMAHWVAAMNGCCWDTGHQGQQWTLYLLHDQFWWWGMTTQMQKMISNCGDASNMKALMPKPQCDPSLLLHLWRFYTLMLPALRQWWSWINLQTWWTVWSFVTTLWNMLWHMWPPIKVQILCLLSVARICLNLQSTGQAPEWPRSQLWKQHHQKALWAYGDTEGLHLAMLKPRHICGMSQPNTETHDRQFK